MVSKIDTKTIKGSMSFLPIDGRLSERYKMRVRVSRFFLKSSMWVFKTYSLLKIE